MATDSLTLPVRQQISLPGHFDVRVMYETACPPAESVTEATDFELKMTNGECIVFSATAGRKYRIEPGVL